nr:hypothetical protein [uncultured Butyrivibrio sp.]
MNIERQALPSSCCDINENMDYDKHRLKAANNDPESLLVMAYYFMFGYDCPDQSYIISEEYYQKYKDTLTEHKPSSYEKNLENILLDAYGKFQAMIGRAHTEEEGWEYNLYRRGLREPLQDKYDSPDPDNDVCINFLQPEICAGCTRWKVWRE